MRLLHSNALRFCAAAVIATLALADSVRAQSAGSARRVLDEMIQALGGDAFLEVQEIRGSGRYFSFTRGELAGGDVFVDYIKFPDMERTEFGRNRDKSITINNGEEGWLINERERSVEPQTIGQVEDFLTGFRTSFDYVTRFVLDLPQTTFQNIGTEFIDFHRTDVIEVRDPEKNLIRFFVARDTRLPVKMQVRRADESVMREEQYGNWHRFQGVMTPLLVTRYRNGDKNMEIRLDSVAYNEGFADSLFAPPAQR